MQTLKHPPRDSDRSYSDVMARAEAVILEYRAKGCGERCVFQESNCIYASGECCACGKISPVQYYGFTLIAGVKGEESACHNMN